MDWRSRAKAIGQRVIAELLGYRDSSVSVALDRDPAPKPIRAVIAAWEIMSPDQRARWLAALEVTAERPRRGRPRKLPPD